MINETTGYEPVELTEAHSVSFSDGKFKHFINPPAQAQILERDTKVSHEVKLNKNGNPIEDDGTEQDEIDAGYYEQCKAQEPQGYQGNVPLTHRARAFRGIYKRFFEVPDDCDIFADVIPVHEIFGDADNPSNVIVHEMRQPEEKEARKMLLAINRRERKPAGNGKEKIVAPSYLKKAMELYKSLLVSVENATVNGVAFDNANRDEFIEHIDPLIQRMIVVTLVNAIDESSQD